MDNKIFVFLLTISLGCLVTGQEPCYNYAAFKACKEKVLPELCNLSTAAPPPVHAPRSASNCLANGVNVCNKHHCLPPTTTPSPTTTCPPPTQAPSTAATRCGDGWIKNTKTGQCYKILYEPIDWQTANRKCAALEEGSSLASIESFDENLFVITEVLERNKAKIMQNVWIGLNDLRTEGTFVWMDGKKLDYKDFKRGEPDNRYGIQDCVEWGDMVCTAQRYALCKNSARKEIVTLG